MSDRKSAVSLQSVADLSALGGGRVIIPDAGRIPAHERVSEIEQTAEFDHEDDGLLDPGSPEFDHSMREKK